MSKENQMNTEQTAKLYEQHAENNRGLTPEQLADAANVVMDGLGVTFGATWRAAAETKTAYARIPDGTLIEFKQVGGQSFYNTGLQFKGELLWWTLPPGSPLEEAARKAMWELIHKDQGEAAEKAASMPAQQAVAAETAPENAEPTLPGSYICSVCQNTGRGLAPTKTRFQGHTLYISNVGDRASRFDAYMQELHTDISKG